MTSRTLPPVISGALFALLCPLAVFAQGSLRVVSHQPGAQVFVDGSPIGVTPLLRTDIPVGPHLVNVVEAGYQDFLTTVDVKRGVVTTVSSVTRQARAPSGGHLSQAQANRPVKLQAEEAGPPVRMPSLGYAAQLIRPKMLLLGASVGFPYLVEARLSAGLLDQAYFALDARVALRTFGSMTVVGVGARIRWIQVGPWAFATSLDVGGGGGPDSRDTVFFDLSGTGSVLLGGRFALSIRARFRVYSDQLCPAVPAFSQAPGCRQPPEDVSAEDVRGRFFGLRLLTALVGEFALTDWINLFGIVEGAPLSQRRAFTNPFSSVMPDADAQVYGRVGVSFIY